MTDRWLIATDLDGTLFDHSLTVLPEVKAALQQAKAAGHAITLATGRMVRATQPIADSLGLDQPLICYQGALVRDGEHVIAHHTLPLPIAHEVLRFAQERGLHVNAYVDDRLFVAERTPEAELYLSLSPMVPLEPVGDLQRFLTQEPTKLVLIQSVPQTESLLPLVTERWGGMAQVVRSHAQFIELTHRAASKGNALLALADSLGIPRERTLAVGDNLNDLSMIRAAGIGVAMGNAPPLLREAAHWVAPSVAEAGLAAAIHRFIPL